MASSTVWYHSGSKMPNVGCPKNPSPMVCCKIFRNKTYKPKFYTPKQCHKKLLARKDKVTELWGPVFGTPWIFSDSL